MKTRLLTCALTQEMDIVLVRQRTRKLAGLVGFNTQDQTRITTAVSEIARNALDYGGGGRVEYWLDDTPPPQRFEITIQDQGKGVSNIDAILSGQYQSETGMGLGIVGARRLMEEFDIATRLGAGTMVRMGKPLPRHARALGAKDVKAISQALSAQLGLDALQEIRQQNQEMLIQLEELSKRETELSQLNGELHDTNRGVVALYAELDERADHLRRADELKSRFLSNMSHEFRTPLNSILALSRLLLGHIDGELSAEQEKQVQFIRKAAENLTELVNDLLDLAKVEAGKIVLTPAEFTVANLFGTLRGMLRPLLVGDTVALIFEDAGDIPAMLTDEGKVSQILRNFLSNAIKFTEQGEVRVWAQADPGVDTVSFFVRDTGIGIAPDDIDTIWQEFGQVSHVLQTKAKGTGLGLPLSRKLAELLGGSVAVESAPGEGSVFSLTLPRVLPQAASESDGPWHVDPGQIPILAVEDNDADAFAFRRALAGTRYQVMPARTVGEARRALDHFAPAAIVLDIMLAGEETWRFLIELKQRELTQHIPVIVASSMQEERKARSLGADDYFNKPVDPVSLVRTLDRATGQHSVTRVLVIDDEEMSRYLVRQLLPRGAYSLNEAATGFEALRYLSDNSPDVILLDLDIPGMNGFDLLSRLSSSGATKEVPAVILTSMHLSHAQRQELAHASEIVQKSNMTTDTLVVAIRNAIGSRAAGSA